MRVLVIVKATKSSEAGEMPGTELLTAMGQYNEELVNAGIMVDGGGLKPSSHGVRVHFSGSDRTVTDGPFAETKELIAGYWIWNVKSLDEAIEWARKCPNPMPEDSDIEIRPFFEAEDFGEEFTPELREQEAALRAMELGLNKPAFQDGPELTIAGLRRSYTQETHHTIPQQWEQFVSQSAAVSDPDATVHYGVIHNSGPDCSFDYLTGLESTAARHLPEEWATLTISSRRYAVFSHAGHVSTIDKAMGAIWRKWAPESGIKLAESAPCFERYTREFNPATGMGGIELWIPLQA